MKFNLSISFLILLTISSHASDICASFYDKSDYQNASSCYLQQLKTDKSLLNYFRAGRALERQGRYQEALINLQEAEKKAIANSDYYEPIYNHMAIVYGGLGNKRLELVYAKKALEVSLKENNHKEIGNNYNNLGNYYLNIGNYQQALDYFLKSLNYTLEKDRAVQYSNIAVTYANLKEFSNAEKYWNDSMKLYKQSGDSLNLCYIQVNIGTFYFNQNRMDDAIVMLEDSKKICHEINEINREANALGLLAMIYYEKGKKNIAKQYIDRAMILAKKSGIKTTLEDITYISKTISE